MFKEKIDNVYLILNDIEYEITDIGFNVAFCYDIDNKEIEIPENIYHIDYIYFDNGDTIEIDENNNLEIYLNNNQEILSFKKFIEIYKPKLKLSGKKDYMIPFIYNSKLNP